MKNEDDRPGVQGGVPTLAHPTLLIGVGNAHRSDDGAGLLVARLLRAKQVPQLSVLEAPGDGAALMEMWKQSDRVILVDAVQADQTPGTIFRLDPHREQIPPAFKTHSTHNFGLAEAIELARSLNALPLSLLIYGIQGENFGFGEALSDPVRTATESLASMIIRDVTAAYLT